MLLLEEKTSEERQIDHLSSQEATFEYLKEDYHLSSVLHDYWISFRLIDPVRIDLLQWEYSENYPGSRSDIILR